MRTLLIASILVAALSACSTSQTYRSPDLPQGGNDEFAVLELQDHQVSGWGDLFTVTHIDGKLRSNGLFTRYEFKPGKRSVTIRYISARIRSADITAHFVAEAGKTYQFVTSIDLAAMRWGFYIVDKATGARIESSQVASPVAR